MSDFSDVSDFGSDSEVESESEFNETPNEVDFGDGDGVNDFEDSDVQMAQKDFEYHEDDKVDVVPQEKEEMNTEESAEQYSNEFDDHVHVETLKNSNIEQVNDVNVEQIQELSSNEYADSICEEYENDIDDKAIEDPDIRIGLEETTESDNTSAMDLGQQEEAEQQPEEVENDIEQDTLNQDAGSEEVKSDETSETKSTETGEIVNNVIPDKQADESIKRETNQANDDTVQEREISRENVTEAADNTSGVEFSEAVMSEETASDTASLEKNTLFENASYKQGQNEYGYLGTCGPTSISNSLNRVTGTNEYTENEVLGNAIENNLCHKSDNPYSSGGTTTKDIVNIIEHVKNPESNIHTEVYEYDKALSVDELANCIDNSGTVAMAGVDSATLWDQRGDVSNSGLFNHTDVPSDHWITVDSLIRDENGSVTGFNVIDSGGGVSEVSRDKFESMYMGDSEHTISDPTVILISSEGDVTNSYETTEKDIKVSAYKDAIHDANAPPEIAEISVDSPEVQEALEFTSIESIRSNTEMTCFEEMFDRALEKEGMTKDDYIDLSHKSLRELSDHEIHKLVNINNSVENPTNDTLMSKVIPESSYKCCLKNDDYSGTVGNCVTRAQDMQDCKTFNDYYSKLGLNYQNNPYDNADKMYVMRYTSPDTEALVTRSYGGTCPEDIERAKTAIGLNDRNTFYNDDPYLGTGVTKDVDGGLGKMELMTQKDENGNATYCIIDDGSCIYEISRNGDEKLAAVRLEGKWYKVKGDE